VVKASISQDRMCRYPLGGVVVVELQLYLILFHCFRWQALVFRFFLLIFDLLCKRFSLPPYIGSVVVALFIKHGESLFWGITRDHDLLSSNYLVVVGSRHEGHPGPLTIAIGCPWDRQRRRPMRPSAQLLANDGTPQRSRLIKVGSDSGHRHIRCTT
jgi:hypothetical protein